MMNSDIEEILMNILRESIKHFRITGLSAEI
jgi:hypothetical protein